MEKRHYPLLDDNGGVAAEQFVDCAVAMPETECEQAERFLQRVSPHILASAMEQAWEEHLAGRTQSLSAIVDEAMEARTWR